MARVTAKGMDEIDSGTSRGGRRLRRILVVTGATLFVLIVSAVVFVLVFGLRIAGQYVRGAIARTANESIVGTVDVDRVALSWLGPQRIEGVRLRDAQGNLVADVNLEATASVLGVLRGSRDFGVLRLSGEINATRKETTGSLGVQEALAPRQPRVEEPADPGAPRMPTRPASASRLPLDFAVGLDLSGLTIKYVDANPAPGAARAASIALDTAALMFRVGSPMRIDVDARVNVDGQPGTVRIESVVDGLTRPDGLMSPELATVDVRADVDAPAGLLDAFPEIAAFLDRSGDGASDRIVIAVRANGDSKQIDAKVEAAAPGSSVQFASRVIPTPHPSFELTEPLLANVTLTPGAVRALGLEEHGFGMTSPTRAAIRVDALGAPISADIDTVLNGLGAVRASLETGHIHGWMDEGGRRVAVDATPVSIAFDTPGASGPATLRASTSATYVGQPAGDLRVDVRIEGADALVRRRPTNNATPVRIHGEAALTGFATSIAKPFLEGTGIDILTDVGPRLDVTLTATTDDGAAGLGGGIPASRVAVRARSDNVEASADALIDGDAVRTTGDGLALTVRSVGPVMARLLEGAGVRVGGAPSVNVVARDASVPLTRGGAPFSLEGLRGELTARVGAFDATPEGADAPIRVQGAEASAALAPGKAPTMRARATGVYEGASFPIALDGALPGRNAQETLDLLGRGALPSVNVRVVDAPIALARIAGLDEYVGLAHAAAGDTLTLTLDLTAREDVIGAARWVASAGAARLKADASGLIEPGRVVFDGAAVETTLTPEAARIAVERFAPDVSPRPALAHDVRATTRLGAMEIPRGADGALDTSGVGPVAFSLEAHNAVGVQNAARIDGKPVGLSLLDARASGTYALFGDKAMTLTAQTGVRGMLESQESPLAQAAARARVRGDGSVEEASVRLSGVDAERFDRMLNQPELTALSLGSPFTIDATLTPDAAGESQRARVRVEAPRLTLETTATLKDDVLSLDSPIDAQWTMDPRWASRYLTATDDGSAPPMTFIEPTTIRVQAPRLAFALGDAPLRPDVFAAEARLSADLVALRTNRGETVRLEGVTGAVNAGGASAPNALAFGVDVRSVGGARPGAADGQTRITGRVSNFADERGAVNFDAARVDTLDATGELPSALLDALANQGGRLAELLGPTVRSQIAARNLSRRSGTLSAGMNSHRAEGRLEGRVEDGVFVATAPATFTLHEITPEFSKMTLDFLFPFVTNLEKRREDGPARLTMTNIRTPIEATIDSDGDNAPDKLDMRRLNGDARLDLGQVRFETSSLLGRVLKPIGIRGSGKTLDKFPPIEVKVRDGVATYERTRIPLGEFAVESRGTVDLHRERMDLVVYVPLFALVDEIAGAFGRVPGLDRLTMVPLRLRGRFGDVSPQPAPDLLLEEIGTNLPREILDRTIGPLEDLLKGGGKKKKK